MLTERKRAERLRAPPCTLLGLRIRGFAAAQFFFGGLAGQDLISVS